MPTTIGEPDAGDRRFSASAWGEDPFYDYLRRSYVLNARFALAAIEAADMDEATRKRLLFSARQMVDAMSPANYVATNPEAMRLALESHGESLARGVGNLMGDYARGRIATTDESRFEVGKNLAVTPGSVVFENDLIQLIQYAPATPTVHRRPLLMVPPCINKFYVLDLQPDNSFVRYAVAQGHTVFMVSWQNPLEREQRFTWDDYLRLGPLAALEAVRRITGSGRKVPPKVNVLGFCVGGTLLASALAVLGARGEDWVQSLTLLAAFLDFGDVGDIGVFVDEASLTRSEAEIGGPAGGLLPGRQLMAVFSALRANDLVWSYVVNNYLKGGHPAAFDILHWNADSTNLPGPMYCWYLRHLYLENSLREAGKLTMLGERIDLSRIAVPAYVLATREDHIVPWHSAYRSPGLLGGPARFVLGASGHIAGIVNPAAANRRSHWVNERPGVNGIAFPEDGEAWLAAATERPGSWWNDWAAWLAPQGGGRAKARQALGGGGLKPIEPAPGRYVLRRVD
jgi:polyhydroxyalkanoate synthase